MMYVIKGCVFFQMCFPKRCVCHHQAPESSVAALLACQYFIKAGEVQS